LAARIHQSLAKSKQRDNVIPVFELQPVARAPWGRCLEVLDVALRCGVPRIVLIGFDLPPKNADLRKLVRKLKEPSVKANASFAIRFEDKPLNAADKRVPIPMPKRVHGAYAGFFKPEHIEFRDDEEAEEEEYEFEDGAETRVERGLDWLAKRQRKDGTWFGGADATAMATLAFLAHGPSRSTTTAQGGLEALVAQKKSSVLVAIALAIGFGESATASEKKAAQARLDTIAGTKMDRERIESLLANPRDWFSATLAFSTRGGEDWKRWRVLLGKKLETQGRDGCWGSNLRGSDITETATMVLCAIAFETNEPFLKIR
jgi:hypothetical protein